MAYALDNYGGAKARLAQFKAKAAKHANGSKHWSEARYSTLRDAPSACCGFNGEGRHRVPVFFAFRDYFERKKYADEIVSLDHSGWFTDGQECSETARGIVVRLPHGRLLAGYELSMNDERVYFLDTLFDDERDAARMADEHARVIGEQESEHQDKQRAAQALADKLTMDRRELERLLALRNHPRIKDVRGEIPALIAKMRRTAETLATEYKDCDYE